MTAVRRIRYLALVAVLVLASSCLYFLKTSTLPSVGTGYLSPSTVLPNYVSSHGVLTCSDIDELDPPARLAGTTESGEEDRIGVTRVLEYMERHLHAKQRHFDPRADKEWLGINIGRSWDLASYRQELMDTYTTYLTPQGEPMPEYMHLVQSRLSLRSPEMKHPPRPRQILTTSKERPLPWSFSRWRSLHRGWKIRVFEDERLRLWVEDTFRGTRAEAVWAGLPRAVLKTDVFRYMAMLLEGGVYADSDTAPVIPVDQWGTPYENATDPLLVHLSRVVSPLRNQAEPDVPSLVLSVESDAIDFGWDNWRDVGLVRAVQIVQWTMAARPGHPVFLDAIGRTLRKTEEIAEMERQAMAEGERFTPESALEWTGPGVFTDCVYRYLLARYGFHPRELLHLKEPLRIGDVLILPAGSFHAVSPWEPSDTWRPYAAVWHGFWGRWREEDGSDLQRELANRTKEALGKGR